MLLLDTHALFWWANQTPDKLSRRQTEAIETAATLAVSTMSCWELAWLVAHGRIVLRLSIADWLRAVEQSGVVVLPVSKAIALSAVALPEHHKDPVDRIIIATTLEHDASLVSVDQVFPKYRELEGRLIA